MNYGRSDIRNDGTSDVRNDGNSDVRKNVKSDGRYDGISDARKNDTAMAGMMVGMMARAMSEMMAGIMAATPKVCDYVVSIIFSQAKSKVKCHNGHGRVTNMRPTLKWSQKVNWHCHNIMICEHNSISGNATWISFLLCQHDRSPFDKSLETSFW